MNKQQSGCLIRKIHPSRIKQKVNARLVREANRLKQYDYSQAGYYFVTICIQGRVCLLGDIVNDNMIPNNAGKMIENSWRQLPNHYDGVEIDSCQIRPCK